jgi:hypothetical protein
MLLHVFLRGEVDFLIPLASEDDIFTNLCVHRCSHSENGSIAVRTFVIPFSLIRQTLRVYQQRRHWRVHNLSANYVPRLPCLRVTPNLVNPSYRVRLLKTGTDRPTQRFLYPLSITCTLPYCIRVPVLVSLHKSTSVQAQEVISICRSSAKMTVHTA